MNTRWSRRSLLGLAPVVVGAFLVRADASPESMPGATPNASPAATPLTARPVSVADQVEIELTDSGFRPNYVQATNGHALHVTLKNTGTRDHGFQIARLDVDVTVASGGEKKTTIDSPPLGDFTFTSDAPGDEEFEGTLVFYI